MPLNFCANLSMMFQESTSILDRYNLAKQCGFRAVECSHQVFAYPVEEVVLAKEASGLQHILLDSYAGDTNKGELGLAAVPGQQDRFRKSIEQAITYCKALECKFVHIMAGNTPHRSAENDLVYVENIRLAALMLEKERIVALIEPINRISRPLYYLNDLSQALEMVEKINRPNVRLLADIFHFQMDKLDLTNSIVEAYPYISHMQIAQAPDRDEPSDIAAFESVFSLLESLDYGGWIGLEYKPANGTKSGLKWVEAFGYSM